MQVTCLVTGVGVIFRDYENHLAEIDNKFGNSGQEEGKQEGSEGVSTGDSTGMWVLRWGLCIMCDVGEKEEEEEGTAGEETEEKGEEGSNRPQVTPAADKVGILPLIRPHPHTP